MGQINALEKSRDRVGSSSALSVTDKSVLSGRSSGETTAGVLTNSRGDELSSEPLNRPRKQALPPSCSSQMRVLYTYYAARRSCVTSETSIIQMKTAKQQTITVGYSSSVENLVDFANELVKLNISCRLKEDRELCVVELKLGIQDGKCH